MGVNFLNFSRKYVDMYKDKKVAQLTYSLRWELQYCAKVMQTNFDEFPGFSGLFDENSLETNFRRYFAAFSRHLLFQPREFSSESSLRVVLRREFSCDNSLFPIIRSEFSSEISSIVALKFSRKVCYE